MFTRLSSLLLAAFLLAACNGCHAQHGSTFMHPHGFAVDLPSGWSAVDHGQGQVQLLPPNPGAEEAFVLIAAPSEGVRSVNDPAVIANAEQEVRKNFPLFQRAGAAQPMHTALGEAIVLRFAATPMPGQTVQLSVYLVVVGETAISLVAVGMQHEMAARSAPLDALFASVRPGAGASLVTTPSTGSASTLHDGQGSSRDWAQRLSGSKLTRMSGYNSGYGSGGMSSRSDLSLYPNGRFEYYSTSSVSISVDGLGGGSSGEDSDSGTWRVVTVQGAPHLELTSDSGERGSGELSRSGSETYMAGSRVYVTDL